MPELAVEEDCACDGAVEEGAVVGDYKDGAGVVEYEAFQPLQCFDVEVVGRLIEQQELWLAQEKQREAEAGLLAAAEGGDGRAVGYVAQAETLQDGGGTVLALVATEGVEAGQRVGVGLHGSFGVERGGEGVGRALHLVLGGDDFGLGFGDGLRYGEGAGVGEGLREVAYHGAARGEGDGAGVWGLLAGDYAQQGGFARAVGADEGDVLAVVD